MAFHHYFNLLNTENEERPLNCKVCPNIDWYCMSYFKTTYQSRAEFLKTSHLFQGSRWTLQATRMNMDFVSLPSFLLFILFSKLIQMAVSVHHILLYNVTVALCPLRRYMITGN